MRDMWEECGGSEGARVGVAPGDIRTQVVQRGLEETHQETEREAALGGAPEQAAEGPGHGGKVARLLLRWGQL